MVFGRLTGNERDTYSNARIVKIISSYCKRFYFSSYSGQETRAAPTKTGVFAERRRVEHFEIVVEHYGELGSTM